MDMSSYIAKSVPQRSIAEHTQDLVDAADVCFELYKDYFSELEIELIKLACKYHDYGKVIFPFQKKIKKLKKAEPETKELADLYKSIPDSENIPHGYISPAFLDILALEEKYGKRSEECELLIYAIYHHHYREHKINSSQIKQIIEKDLITEKSLNLDIKVSRQYLKYIDKESLERSDGFWLKYAVIKGMLNKFDYYASSNASYGVEINPLHDERYLYEYVEQKYSDLRGVQIFMRDNAAENLVVIASTGIGKTEAALLWVGKSKAFYTLPLKVSINAIYERIANGYGYKSEKVTLLHSDALSYLISNEDEAEDNKAFMKYQASKAFSYPITVCTIDQLFAFVYKAAGSEILLATLKYSKLIIDEIQAYSPEIVAKIIYGLKLITDIGGKFAIITATMPPIFEHFMQKLLGKDVYKKPPEPFYSTEKARHKIKYIKAEIDYDKIKAESKTKKVLVICNTVKKAQEIYAELKDECNAYVLHSHFIKKHRDMLETNIKAFAECCKAKGVWISTQIVEASLDIDFDLLITEMCPADNLLQRMGRCYRKRPYEGDEPNVLIYDTENGKGTVYEYTNIYDASVKYLAEYDGEIFEEEDKIEYVNKVYNTDDLQDSDYYKEIEKTIKNMTEIVPNKYSLNDAKKNIRDIESVVVMPEKIYTETNAHGDIDRWIETIKDRNIKSGNSKKIKANDNLYSLTLSLNPYSSKALKRDKSSIARDIDIFRIPLGYEFYEDKGQGIGLINGEMYENEAEGGNSPFV